MRAFVLLMFPANHVAYFLFHAFRKRVSISRLPIDLMGKNIQSSVQTLPRFWSNVRFALRLRTRRGQTEPSRLFLSGSHSLSKRLRERFLSSRSFLQKIQKCLRRVRSMSHSFCDIFDSQRFQSAVRTPSRTILVIDILISTLCPVVCD